MLSCCCAVVALVCSIWGSAPWCDELTFVDSAVNFLRSGDWGSNVWYCVYSPLFPLVSAGAMQVLGCCHFVSSLVTVAFALIASLVLLRIFRRRGWFGNERSELAFVILFWFGSVFSWIVMNGRPDTMTLLFTVLLADALAPGGMKTGRMWRTVAYAGGLVLTSSYMLPVLFVYGCVLLVVSRGSDRKAVFRCGICAAVGVAAAYMAVAAFYWWQHEFVRFVGFMTYFNSLTGYKCGSLAERLVRSYRACPEALVLAGIVIILTKRRLEGALVLLIPAVMTMGGRYEPYYAWTVYVSAVVVFVRAIPVLPKHLPLAIVVSSVLWCGWSLRSRAGGASLRLEEARAARAFVDAHRKMLIKGPVVVAADTVGDVSLYYPLLSIGADIWYRGYETLTGPSDRQKFEIGLASVVADPERRRWLMDKAFAVQDCMETLPRSGMLICHLKKDWERVLPLVMEQGYQVEILADCGEFRIYRFEKRDDRLAAWAKCSAHAVAFTSRSMTSRAGFLRRISGSMKRRLPASSRRTLSLDALTSVTARRLLPKK